MKILAMRVRIAIATALLTCALSAQDIQEAEACAAMAGPEANSFMPSGPLLNGPVIPPAINASGYRAFAMTATGVEARDFNYAADGAITTTATTPTALTVGILPNTMGVFPGGGALFVVAGDTIEVYQTEGGAFGPGSLEYTITDPFGVCGGGNSFAGEPVVMTNVNGADYLIVTYDRSLCVSPGGVAMFELVTGSDVLTVVDATAGSFIDYEPVNDYVVWNSAGSTRIFSLDEMLLTLTPEPPVATGALDFRIKIPPVSLVGSSQAFVIGTSGGSDALYRIELLGKTSQSTIYSDRVSDYAIFKFLWTDEPALPGGMTGDLYVSANFVTDDVAVYVVDGVMPAGIVPFPLTDSGDLNIKRPPIPGAFATGNFYAVSDSAIYQAEVDPSDLLGQLDPATTANRALLGSGVTVGYSSNFDGGTSNILIAAQNDHATIYCVTETGWAP